MSNTRIKSVIEGRDPEVLDMLFSFYARPEGKIIDVTCNAKRMWKGLNTEGIAFCDIDIEQKPDIVCDFAKTPFKDNEISVIVFDPPHLPSAAGSEKSLKPFVSDYGLGHSVKGDNINEIFFPFLTEANRILKN